jgi:hypothetical protein
MGRPKKNQFAGIKFTGPIAKPIDDIDCILPLRTDLDLHSPEYQKSLMIDTTDCTGFELKKCQNWPANSEWRSKNSISAHMPA